MPVCTMETHGLFWQGNMWELSREYFFLLVTRACSCRKMILLKPVWSDNALKSLKNGFYPWLTAMLPTTFGNLLKQEVTTNNRWQPRERTNLLQILFFPVTPQSSISVMSLYLTTSRHFYGILVLCFQPKCLCYTKLKMEIRKDIRVTSG